MNIDIAAKVSQSLKYYMVKDISGAQLSESIKACLDEVEDLTTNQERTFNYYIDFFKKEGENAYLPSNKYLKEEVTELGEFLEKLESD